MYVLLKLFSSSKINKFHIFEHIDQELSIAVMIRKTERAKSSRIVPSFNSALVSIPGAVSPDYKKLHLVITESR